MLINAEIHPGTRTVLEYFLAPPHSTIYVTIPPLTRIRVAGYLLSPVQKVA